MTDCLILKKCMPHGISWGMSVSLYDGWFHVA